MTTVGVTVIVRVGGLGSFSPTESTMVSALEDVETGIQYLVVDSERREHFDDLVMRAAGFDDQPVGEASRGNGSRDFARAYVNASHHAPAPGGEVVLTSHSPETGVQQLSSARYVGLKSVGCPEMSQSGCRRNERVVVSTKCAVVLTRGPHIQVRSYERKRERQAHA